MCQWWRMHVPKHRRKSRRESNAFRGWAIYTCCSVILYVTEDLFPHAQPRPNNVNVPIPPSEYHRHHKHHTTYMHLTQRTANSKLLLLLLLLPCFEPICPIPLLRLTTPTKPYHSYYRCWLKRIGQFLDAVHTSSSLPNNITIDKALRRNIAHV